MFCNKSPEIDPPMQMTALINITTAMPSMPVAPNAAIIKLTISRTVTVTPEIGMLLEPTKPVR